MTGSRPTGADGESRLRRMAGEMVVFRPHSGAHWVAGRAGISILVPLLVLWATDHLAWSIFAAFGAFTSLYGRNHGHHPRLRMQAQAGLLLTLVTGLGVMIGLSEHRAWLAVPAAALLTLGVALLSDRADWHPPGALFPVFAFTACASLPGEPLDVLIAWAVAGATAAFAVLVGNVGALWRARAVDAVPDPAHDRAPMPWWESLRSHAGPSATAVLIAGGLATAVGIGHPYWAMVSAVVPLVAREFSVQVVRGLHRLVGTAVGLVVAVVLLNLELRGLALILVVVLLQVSAELLVGRNYALALVAVTPLALLMVSLVAPVDPRVLVVDRGVETLIGVLIGLVVGYLARPNLGMRWR